MSLPRPRRLERADPVEWLILRLAGKRTVVVNAQVGVVDAPDGGGALPVLENALDGHTLVANVTGLGIPGHGRLTDG